MITRLLAAFIAGFVAEWSRGLPQPPTPTETTMPATVHAMLWTAGEWRCPICGRRLRESPDHPLGLQVVAEGVPTVTHILGARSEGDDDPPPAWLAGLLREIEAGEA